MREIKFRAWDKKTKIMIDLVKMTPLSVDSKLLPGVFLPFEDNWELMQYTGLKDKNGKEIYEGDTVRLGEGSKGYETRPGKAAIIYRSAQYFAQHTDGGWFRMGSMNPENIEVIGNIYENPELLEGKL